MFSKVLWAGTLGGLTLVIWTFVLNGVFGFRSSVDMRQVPAERQVYETLRQYITAPGRYVCNPGLTPQGLFPDSEPVFSILYSGVGHGSAGRHMLLHLAVAFVAATIAAWMLSQTSQRFLSSYLRRLSFYTAIGLLIAIFGDLMAFGIGGYPLRDALLLAGNQVVTWTVVGLVAAWRLAPAATNPADAQV